ncbi:MAG: ABC transporter ATP-binding protein [Clostridiaceae bacterium]|nr:ABC transporter ATP-binding protein [Clostridiaceae bacterium]MDD6273551.1 ABC transporter ATP-binding protein [Clostridiaceae bacterium]
MILRTEDVCKTYRSGDTVVEALKNIRVNIQPGKLTMLRGRSGSGKTTLMNLLGALDQPTSGKIYFKDQEITSLSEAKRDLLRRREMGFVFQSVALISNMSAYENVEFGLRLAGVPAAERRARAEACLELVGLGKRMTHRSHELSGGEQQRVAIARAIAHKPGLIFADEPTAELDTNMGLLVMQLFKKLVAEEGLTILMTTHDPNMVELADHVYVLEDGVIIDER